VGCRQSSGRSTKYRTRMCSIRMSCLRRRGMCCSSSTAKSRRGAFSHIVVTFYGDPAARDATGNAQVPFLRTRRRVMMVRWKRRCGWIRGRTPRGRTLTAPPWIWMNRSGCGRVSSSPPVTGCDELAFTPELFAQPTTSQADTPTGLEFETKLPPDRERRRARNPRPEGHDRGTTGRGHGRTRPGVAGFRRARPEQIGWLGETPYNFSQAPPACPEASRIGTLELETPLIPGVLQGELYLASENEKPVREYLRGLYRRERPDDGGGVEDRWGN